MNEMKNLQLYNGYIPYKTIILHKICIINGKSNFFLLEESSTLHDLSRGRRGSTHGSFSTATKELSVAASNQGL